MQTSRFNLERATDFQCCDNCIELADVVSHLHPDDVWCQMCFRIDDDGLEIDHPNIKVCPKWDGEEDDD